MVYEIFKETFASNPTWGHFALATVLSAYSVYLVGMLLSWLWSFSYSFIYEGKKTIPNWLVSKVAGLIYGKDLSKLKDGWYHYRSVGMNSYWNYHYIRRGYPIDYRDTKPDNVLKVDEDLYYRGFKILEGWSTEVLVVLLPLMLSAAFLFMDTFPTISVCLGLYFAVLLMARKAVGIASKFSEHMEDKSVHKE